MTKRLLASALAAAIALTSATTAPARAGNLDNFEKFLLGATTLFIIGSAISNSNRSGSVQRVAPPKQRVVVKPRYSKVVPGACLRHNQYAHGPRLFFPRHCLHRNMAHAHRLPGACLRNVWTHQGQRTVYAASCLRSYGWSRG